MLVPNVSATVGLSPCTSQVASCLILTFLCSTLLISFHWWYHQYNQCQIPPPALCIPYITKHDESVSSHSDRIILPHRSSGLLLPTLAKKLSLASKTLHLMDGTSSTAAAATVLDRGFGHLSIFLTNSPWKTYFLTILNIIKKISIHIMAWRPSSVMTCLNSLSCSMFIQ